MQAYHRASFILKFILMLSIVPESVEKYKKCSVYSNKITKKIHNGRAYRRY